MTKKIHFNEIYIVLRNRNHFYFELYEIRQSGFKLDKTEIYLYTNLIAYNFSEIDQ